MDGWMDISYLKLGGFLNVWAVTRWKRRYLLVPWPGGRQRWLFSPDFRPAAAGRCPPPWPAAQHTSSPRSPCWPPAFPALSHQILLLQMHWNISVNWEQFIYASPHSKITPLSVRSRNTKRGNGNTPSLLLAQSCVTCSKCFWNCFIMVSLSKSSTESSTEARQSIEFLGRFIMHNWSVLWYKEPFYFHYHGR